MDGEIEFTLSNGREAKITVRDMIAVIGRVAGHAAIEEGTMCVYSMVSDHFNPLVPKEPWQPNLVPSVWPSGGTITIQPTTFAAQADINALRVEVARLTKIVEDFIAAKAAAETVDRLIGQPDCVDPEKARLEERVADLEKRLSAVREAIGA